MERPNARGSNNFVVGMFVFIAILVGAGFVVFMGGGSIFGKQMKVHTAFEDVRGLNVGAPVFVSGIQVGRISEISFPDSQAPMAGNAASIVVTFSLFGQHKNRVRKDSEASITTQGVLGDKVLVVSPGSFEAGAVENLGLIASHREKELSDYLSKGGHVVDDFAEVAHNLNLLLKDLQGSGRVKTILANLEKASAQMAITSKEDLGPTMKTLKTILGKIDRGEGTLGALINDSSLHEDLRVLLGGAKRSQVVRFLVRQAIANKDKETLEPKKKNK